MRTADVVYAATLSEGRGGIDSPLQTEEQREQQAEAIIKSMVPVSRKNTADCGDERLFLASAADVFDNPGLLKGDDETIERDITYSIFGGLYVGTTHAGVLSDLEIVNGAESFTKAFDVISGVLDDLKYEDSGHTTQLSFDEQEKTECGFEEGFEAALGMTLDDDALLAYTLNVVALLNGAVSFDDLNKDDQRHLLGIVATAEKRLVREFFYDHNPVAHRDALKKKYGGRNLSILKSVHDATHGHYGKSLVVVEDLGQTPDQKKLALGGNDSFVYSRGFARKVSGELGGSEQEKRKLSLAFDFESVVIANKLFGKDMPVFVIPEAA